jgi:pimeloyl-ACP methyl ester carboxylesterase
MFVAQTPAHVRKMVKTTMQSAPQHVVLGMIKGRLDPARGKPDAIKVPLLVIVASGWPADYEAYVRKLAPQVEYRVMEGVGHFLMLEKPDAFNAILAGFLKRPGVMKP